MLEKLKPFYTFTEEHGSIYVSRVGNESAKKFIPCSNEPFYFTFGISVKDTNEVEQLAADGKVVKMLCSEIYREFLGWDDEKLCMKMHGYDLRTKKYLETVKKNIGLLDEQHGYDEEKLNISQTLSIWVNASDIEIGQAQDGRWCAQWGVRTDIDDYDITRLYFNHKPTEKDVLTAQKISSLSFKFFIRKLKPVFRCWECGNTVHWIDSDGDFDTKVDNLEESYCGC